MATVKAFDQNEHRFWTDWDFAMPSTLAAESGFASELFNEKFSLISQISLIKSPE